MSGVACVSKIIQDVSARVLAQPPVRLITGDEPIAGPAMPADAGWSAGSIAGWAAFVLVLVIATVALVVLKRRSDHAADGSNLDQDAARALAKRLGLSRRARATLWDLAKVEGNGSALDLLVSVKKLNAAAARRAPSTSGVAARESLRELWLALGADAPTFPAEAPTRHDARKPRQAARTGTRPSVVSPRMISRKG